MEVNLKNFALAFDLLTVEEKKDLMQILIKEVVVYKDKIKLTLYDLPQFDYKLIKTIPRNIEIDGRKVWLLG